MSAYPGGQWAAVYALPRLYWGLLLVAVLGVFAALPFEPWIQPDSAGYLNWASQRQPLYPAFLWVFQAALPSTVALKAVVVAQVGLGFGACLFCARRLQTLLDAPRWLGGVLFCVLVAPYFVLHQMGHAMISEGVAYPLFLMMAATFLTGVLKKEAPAFAWSLVFTTFLALTRGQFLCLYPVWALAVIGPSGLSKRGRLGLVMGICASFLGVQGIERGTLYLKDGHFAAVPFTGSLAVVLPLYIASPSDGATLPPAEKELFEALYPELEAQHLLARDRPADTHPLWHIETIYNTIQYGHVFPAFQKLGLDAYTADRTAMGLAAHLTLQNCVARVQLFIQMWVKRWEYGYLLLMGFLGAAVLGLLITQRAAFAPMPRALFWGIALECANMGTVLAVEMPLMRYLLYTTVLMGCLLILLCWRGLSAHIKIHN